MVSERFINGISISKLGCFAYLSGVRMQYRTKTPRPYTRVSFKLMYWKLLLVRVSKFQETSSSDENRWVTLKRKNPGRRGWESRKL